MLKNKTNYRNDIIYDGKIANLAPMKDQTKDFDPMRPTYIPQYMYTTKGLFTKETYDFTETYRIIDTESYVSSALRKKKTLLLKDGYNLISENDEDVRYVKNRLAEIAHVTDKTFKNLIEDFASSLINNHNAFILVVRDSKSSSGGTRKIFKKSVEPIAGYYVLPETKMKVMEDMYGQVISYRYEIKTGLYKYFDTDQVLHLSLEKKPGSNVGTPPLESLVDDLRALRQIEESLERLIYKLSTPIIHAKVGTETKPAGIDRLTNEREVDQVNEALQMLEESGGITTSERVEFKILGAESQALRLGSYLDYFKNRVLVGLTISDIDLGIANSTSSAAAAEITKPLAQNVQMYQQAIQDFVTDRIFASLLLESDKYLSNMYLEDTEKVALEFTNSNMDAKIKAESHYINEVNAGLMTVDEYRATTGKRKLTAKEKQEILETKTGGSPATSEGSTANTTNPTNQHTDETVATAQVQDCFNISKYIKHTTNNTVAAGNMILEHAVRDSLVESELEFNKEDLHEFVSRLTTSLQQFIIGRLPQDGVYSLVENMLYKKIIEIIEENN